ncbi:MAG: hypothetical protein RL240_2457 [Planctomycetota bacterium]|jgi:hypothetical protein
MFLQRPNYAMVGRSHASPDGGGFPGAAHRLAAGGYPTNVATRRQTVEVFLVRPTAWQRMATIPTNVAASRSRDDKLRSSSQ